MANLQVCVPNKEAGRDDVKHSVSYVQAVVEGTASLPPSLQTLRLQPVQEQQEPRLYICGGFTGSDMAASTEVFNVRKCRFERDCADNMARPRFQLVTCVLKKNLYAMGGSDGARVLRTVERLDTTSGNRQWVPMPPMARPRLFACSATVDGCIYVAGGCVSGQTALASAERYSAKRHAWQLLPSMRRPRAFAVAAPLSKKHFMVCGGYDQAALSSTECFSPSDGKELGEWKALPEMLHKSYLAAHAQDEFGNLYICGGSSSSSGPGEYGGGHGRQHPVKDAQRFHSVLHTWQPLPPMIHERCGSVAAVMGGRLFVCGGFGLQGVTRDSAECFDTASGAWSLLEPMREARSFFASRLVEGKLYVFGGKAGNTVLRTAERYSFSNDAWEDLPEMTVPRTGHTVDQV